MRVQSLETVERVDSVIVEQRDTLREITTITIDRNDKGDTLKVVQVTDRSSIRDRDRFKVQDSRLMIKTDTVYIEKRDSSLQVKAYGLQEDGTPTISSKLSAVSKILKWIFFIIIGLIGLIVTAKVCLRKW